MSRDVRDEEEIKTHIGMVRISLNNLERILIDKNIKMLSFIHGKRRFLISTEKKN